MQGGFLPHRRQEVRPDDVLEEPQSVGGGPEPVHVLGADGEERSAHTTMQSTLPFGGEGEQVVWEVVYGSGDGESCWAVAHGLG